ncbi:MAG TPA: capsular polysaccharide synthesis protein [Microlunatus sp.]
MSTAAEYFERARAAAAADSWSAAADAYVAGLRLDPDAAPRWHYGLGHALDQLQDLPGAEIAYSEAIRRRRNVPAWWHFKLAVVQARLQHWQEAAVAYETAIKGRGSRLTPGWCYRLGLAYEKLGRWDDALASYRRGLALDPNAGAAEWRMLEREAREFPGRRTLLRFVAAHLDELRAGAGQPLELGEDRTEKIYYYWAQGIGAAPPMVRLCHRQLMRHASIPVLVLDEPAMSSMIELPDDIEARGIAPTHRTDLLRLELLARHGGTWLDATCLVVEDPALALRTLRQPSGYFAFAKRRSTVASWLMSSSPDHYLVRMLREALHCYWRNHDQLSHYYVLHYLFEALTELDEPFADAWARTPRLRFDPPFQLRWNLLEPYREQDFERMLAGSFVHKLTYKYEPEQAGPDTVAGHLLQTF